VHPNRYEDGLHEATAAVVVVGPHHQPHQQAEQTEHTSQEEEFGHDPGSSRLSLAESAAAETPHTGFELPAQAIVVQVLADQHQLVAAFARPIAVVDREALARQMEDVAPLALLEPEDALGAEHPPRQLIVEEILEFSQR